MSTEQTFESIKILNEDKYLQDRVAQLNARYILFNTNEVKENFPNYSVRDDDMTLLGFQYLNLGCRLAEKDQIDAAAEPLEKGAQTLEYIYGSENNEVSFRKYHVLISALAYYASFQYSKSYILINKIENDTTITGLVSLFLKRRFIDLQNKINTILIDNKYIFLSKTEGIDEMSDRIYEIVIARALGKLISYLNFGNRDLLEEAKKELKILKEVAETKQNVDVWWVIRLILIIILGIEKSSLWSVFRSHYDELPELGYSFIYSHVFAIRTKIHEFFTSQRKALSRVIGQESGVIISMPTSSGKTRISEVAILDCKIRDSSSKILFIAPFRSLAFEIENDLEAIFNPIGVFVSQLYGGSLFTKIDEKLIEETDIIIATPEKAKALFRSDSETLKAIKLVVVDEGHLLGANDRLIRNELFLEELRYHIEKNKGKFVVLSAVLPNPKDLANWLTNSEENIYNSDWRPSEERMGTLEWTGRNVNLNWVSADDERESFNNRFIVAELQERKPRETTDKYSPGDKNEAVAATAIKLFTFGPVLIFVGVKKSVFTMARAYLKMLGDVENFSWKNQNNWKTFELAVIEFDGIDSTWMKFARKGILCHNSDLPSDVRIPLERLMRTEKPRVIIATSTLGQGVNLGVSTVIFSTFYQAGDPLSHSDFWNIAGRAGRAFVDQEGKILVALDTSKRANRKERNKNNYNQRLILRYFEKSQIQNAESGLLWLIKMLKHSAIRFEGFSFEKLLEIIAENSFEELNDAEKFLTDLDLIDDTLLAIHQLANREEDILDVTWVETFFRKSLAFVQLQNETDAFLSGDEMLLFIKERIKGIIRSVGETKNDWQSHIKSGIPLQSDLLIEQNMAEIIGLVKKYFEVNDFSINAKINLLFCIENLVNSVPILKADYLESKDLNQIREKWLLGESYMAIKPLENSQQIISKHYSFQLPWVINGIAKKLEAQKLEHYSDLLQEISILCELGLPNLTAVKIYQAGIKSRASAIEISKVFENDSWDKSINYYKNMLIKYTDLYEGMFSEPTANWLSLFLIFNKKITKTIKPIQPFNIENLHSTIDVILIPKTINKKEYLVSEDLKIIFPIADVKGIDIAELMDLDGVFFKKRKEDKLWDLNVINPNIKIED